ncbi:hypothetical protein EV200_1083 [Pedobacter psychrotolerans]|uniref:Uncharacterized protein n=1 Tax=Pedobacter psychrotolerans TaxID=1843235 RepID=A0A4R2H4J4_9SPHI|nr:hypothetical protein [Pedobacter psychrotolerans]TCO20563.1 hypothetical protein EV200_1083 [Pedobacter psychrotolerans]GGE66455.1 hypothetical protein GCM10011413_36230 [Pedobacter psychrotolerans]
MTTKEILKLYKIEMIIEQVNGYKIKNFIGGGDMEPFFSLAYATADTVDEDVIPAIQHFLNGNIPPIDPDLGGIGALATIYSDAVRFHNPYNGEIEQTIPLEHFKIIALAWRDFLLH